jgi:hypothetical protein
LIVYPAATSAGITNTRTWPGASPGMTVERFDGQYLESGMERCIDPPSRLIEVAGGSA